MQLSIEQIYDIIQEIELPENILRKKAELASQEIYEGSLKKYVNNRIREMYPKTYEAYTIADYSLLKKIVDKKAKAYKEAPVRTLPTPNESTAYQDIVKEYGLNEAMKRLDALYCQHKYALFGCLMSLDEDGSPEFRFMPLAPYEFDVIKDDEGCPKVVILSYPDRTMMVETGSDGLDTIISGAKQDEGAQTKVYAFWTDTNFYVVEIKVDDKGKSMGIPSFRPIPTNPGNVNPYGVLPFVYLPKNSGPNYPIASPLPEQTVEVNSLLSVYLTSGNMQIGQLVLKYPEGQNFQMVTSGLMTGIKLPQSTDPDAPETDASYISPSPNMDAHRTAIMTYVSMILDEQGIRSAGALDSTAEKFSSGLDRAIAEADVQDIIEDNQGLYRCVEEEVFEIVRAQLASINSNPFSDGDLRIVYKKPRMLVSDTELLTNLEKMINLGLLEAWEKFTIVDPNMSEEDAKAKLARIQSGEQSRVSALADAAGMNQEVNNADISGPGNEGNRPESTSDSSS